VSKPTPGPGADAADAPDAPRAERPNLVSGKFVPWSLLAVALLTLAIVWPTLRWIESRPVAAEPLDWAQRDEWPRPPVKVAEIERSVTAQTYGGGPFRDFALALTPEQEVAVHELAALARSDGFANAASRETLKAAATRHPDLFYPHYLLGRWLGLAGRDDAARESLARAFRLAPHALRLTVVDHDGRPVSGLTLGDLEIVCLRSDGHILDQTLRLVFPDVTPDDQGRIHVPLLDAVCRLAETPEPRGYRASYPDPGFFKLPMQTAALDPIVLRPDPRYAD